MAMAGVTIAAVQAAYVLMDQKSTLDKTIDLLGQAARAGARIVVFPEVFIPGTPIWIDSARIWDGDGDWYARLVDQAVVVPGPVTDALGAAAMRADLAGVKELLARGIDANTTGSLGKSPLRMATSLACSMPEASEANVTAIVDALISAGADVNHVDQFGLGDFLMAAQKCKAPVIKRMLEVGVQSGEIRKDVDLEDAAWAIGGMVDQRMQLWLLGTPLPDDLPDRLIDIFFRGVGG